MIKKLFNFFIIIIFGSLLTTFFNKIDDRENNYSKNIEIEEIQIKKLKI